MKKTIPNNKILKNYKDAPEVNIDELAEKWVEMLVEMLLAKDKEGLQKCDEFPKLESA